MPPTYLRQGPRLSGGNSIEPLIDGADAFAAIHDAIKQAREFIYVLAWNLEPGAQLLRGPPDNPGKPDSALGKLLIDKARRGVEVKVLVWDKYQQVLDVLPGATSFKAALAEVLRAGLLELKDGLRAASARPGWSTLRLVKRPPEPEGRAIATGSHHQKLWIMDAGPGQAVVFLGGINAGEHEWETSDHLADDRRRRPLAGVEAWLFDLKEALQGRDASKRAEAERRVQAAANVAASLAGALLPSPLQALLKDHFYRELHAFVMDRETFGPRHDVFCTIKGPAVTELIREFSWRWQLAPKDPGDPEWKKSPPPTSRPGRAMLEIANTAYYLPEGFRREVRRSYERAIANATDYIYMENQYFTSKWLGEQLASRMTLRRELQVVVVLPATPNDPLVTEAATLLQYENVQRLRAVPGGGERLHVLRLGAWYEREARIRGIHVHSKVAIIDDRWVTVGSANLNERSFTYDTEVNAFVEDAFTARKLRDRLWSEHAGTDLSSLASPLAAIRALDRTARSNALRRGPLAGKLLPLDVHSPQLSWARERAVRALARELL